jgi:hypothetical protein
MRWSPRPARVPAAGRQHFDLRLSIEQVVVGLAHDGPGHVHRAREMHHLGDAPAAEVRHPPVADLAGPQQGIDRTQRLLQVHAIEVAVQVVDVDVVGTQPREAGVAFAQHPDARIARFVGPFGHLVADLGGQDPVVARALEQLADHRLRLAQRVGVGGVDEVHAVLSRVGGDAARLGQVGLVGEHHRAQAQRRDPERALAERAVLHGVSWFGCGQDAAGSADAIANRCRLAHRAGSAHAHAA